MRRTRARPGAGTAAENKADLGPALGSFPKGPMLSLSLDCDSKRPTEFARTAPTPTSQRWRHSGDPAWSGLSPEVPRASGPQGRGRLAFLRQAGPPVAHRACPSWSYVHALSCVRHSSQADWPAGAEVGPACLSLASSGMPSIGLRVDGPPHRRGWNPCPKHAAVETLRGRGDPRTGA